MLPERRCSTPFSAHIKLAGLLLSCSSLTSSKAPFSQASVFASFLTHSTHLPHLLLPTCFPNPLPIFLAPTQLAPLHTPPVPTLTPTLTPTLILTLAHLTDHGSTLNGTPLQPAHIHISTYAPMAWIYNSRPRSYTAPTPMTARQ